MGHVINKLLLARGKFMPEIHLRQPQFTYSACGPFTKHEQRIQKFKDTGDTNYMYKNELDKACFVYNAAYSDSKDLTKRTVADKILKNKAFDIAKDPKYDGYQRGLASMVYKFFDSKVSGNGVSSFASKTNLAALKTEVDKIDADKLKTTPADLAKLTNAVEHDIVKKTDYYTKISSIEAQIAGLTKNTVDNLVDITKLKVIDTNSFVNKTKFSADINTLDDKIDGVEKKPLI